MKRTILAAIAALMPLIALCQGVEGDWSGILKVPGTKLTIVFHIGENSTMDVPEQGAKGISVDIKEMTAMSLKLDIPMIMASYEGLMMGGSIVGTFTQVGQPFPLTLKRGAPSPQRPQTPVPPFPYNTEEVSFQSGEAVLSGTLATPSQMTEDTPAVVLVSGSGLQDRDEALMDHKPFAVIADAFAKKGIATLRYDDRGFGRSTGDVQNATTHTFKDDAREAIEYLRSRGFKAVGVLGHSEGGTIAFMLAAENVPDFIVSMAGMAETGEITLRRQLARGLELEGAPKESIDAYVEQTVAQFRANPNPWTTCFLALDPAPYIAKASCPVLAVNGESDVQVACEANLGIIRDLLPSAQAVSYPGLNHLFQHCTTGSTSEYYNIEETMSEEVLADIASWISNLP